MLTLAGLFALGATAPAHAQATIDIDHPWARASMGKTGAVYLTIRNSAATDDRLVGAASPIADKAQLHSETNDNGVMKMRPLAAIDVKAKGQATLKPGGMHLMLIGLKQPLKAGDSFPLTLTFEHAGTIDVTVAVRKAGSMDDMPGMKM
jgi:copper(I)-binding protein